MLTGGYLIVLTGGYLILFQCKPYSGWLLVYCKIDGGRVGRGELILTLLHFLIVIQIYNIWNVFGKTLASFSIICHKNTKYLLRNICRFLATKMCKYKNCKKMKNFKIYKSIPPGVQIYSKNQPSKMDNLTEF